jgi:hypothetical protein
MRRKLEAALRRLPIKPEEEWRLGPAVNGLVIMLATAPTSRRELPSMRRVGRRKTDAELKALHKAADRGDLEEAQRLLDALHGPAIDLLAKPSVAMTPEDSPEPPPRWDGQPHVYRTTGPVFGHSQEKGTAESRASGFMRQRLRAHILPEVAAETLRALQLSREIPVEQGRQRAARDRYAIVLARALASVYADLTGKRPTVAVYGETPHHPIGKAYGPFLDLVAAVFKLAGIQHGAESAAREARKAERTASDAVYLQRVDAWVGTVDRRRNPEQRGAERQRALAALKYCFG